MKCECGLNYVPGLPDDEEQHARVHAEYFSGPIIAAVQQLSPCATYDEFSIYQVDGTCPPSIRDKLAHVAVVAYRTLPRYPPGYDGTVTEDGQRLYIAARDAHVVAMAVTAREHRFLRLAWKTDGSITLVTQELSLRQSYKIARLRTAGGHRRKGLALRLIQTAVRLLPCSLSDLGWEMPFTPPAECLIRRLCPDTFWGCGDSFQLWDTIDRSGAMPPQRPPP